ncbi:MAG: 3-isopropylmalate dehydratase small subunit, partial [Dysgonamonadaceae bacterium]|nr:3-isopropylmalate dehydratase small subunit [Dysgonamonadaceae bacterium]
FFADIHKNNELNNGVLPVEVSEQFLKAVFDSVAKNPKITLTVDLEQQLVTNNDTGHSEPFAINAYKKECFLNGFDDIDYLLSRKDKIEEFEAKSGK